MLREPQIATTILIIALCQVAATADPPALHVRNNVVRSQEVTYHKSVLQSLSSLPQGTADFDTNSAGFMENGGFVEHSSNRRHLLQNLLSSLAGALLGTGSSSSTVRSPTTPAASNNLFSTSFFTPSPPPPSSFTFTQSKTPAPPTPTYSSQTPPSYNSNSHPPPPPTPNYASSSFSSSNAQPPPYSSNHPPPPPPATQYANNPPPYQSYNSQPPPPVYTRTAAPPPPTGQWNSAPPPPYSSGSGPPPPYNGVSSEAAKFIPPPPNAYHTPPPPPPYSSGSGPPPPTPYNAFSSEGAKSAPPPPSFYQAAPPPPSLGSSNAAPPPPQMLSAIRAAAPPPPIGAVTPAPPPPQVAGGTTLAQAQVPPPPQGGMAATGPPPPIRTSNDGVQPVSTQAVAPPPPIGALKDSNVPAGSSGAATAGTVTAPPPPIQTGALDCGVGSSHPLTKCPATSGGAGLANKAAPPPPMPQTGLGSTATLAGAAAPPPPLQGATAGGTKGLVNPTGTGAAAQAPPPPMPSGTASSGGQLAKTGTKTDVGTTSDSAKGTGSLQTAKPTGTGTVTGSTGSGSGGSGACTGAGSSGSCIAGYVSKDVSSKQQVVQSNAVPVNLPNQPVSADSQQQPPPQGSSGGTGSSAAATAGTNNVLAKGAATVAAYPGAFAQQANSVQQANPLIKSNMKANVAFSLTPVTATTSTATSNPPIVPGGTTAAPNGGNINGGNSAGGSNAGPAAVPQAVPNTNAQSNGVDVATIIQQYLVPTLQEIPTVIQSIQQIIQMFGGAGGGSGGAGVGGAGSGGTPVGGSGGGTDPGSAGAVAAGSAVPGGAGGATSTDPAASSGGQPSGASGATDPQQPSGSGGGGQPAGTANPSGDAQPVSAGVSGAQGSQVVGGAQQPSDPAGSTQPAGGATSAGSTQQASDPAGSMQPAGGATSAGGAQQPSDPAGSTQPAGGATSAGGAQQPSDPAGSTQPAGGATSAGGVQQPSDPAGSTQPAGGATSAGGAQQPSDPAGSTQPAGGATSAGGAQQPSDPAGATLQPGVATDPTGAAQQPSNPSGAVQPAGAAGSAGGAQPSGTGGAVQSATFGNVGGATSGATALSGSKLQVQSLLQLGPGPDTLRPIGTGGGRGLIGGSYGASSAMPDPADPNRSTQQPKPRLYVLPNCLYMIRAGDLCGTTGPACGLTWDKIAGCGPQQLPGGCCQPGFSCRVDSDMQNKCLAFPAPSYNFSDPACNPIPFKGSCGKDGDCCPDGWTCQAQQGASPSCQPAMASLIPPGTESLILDYQSARAMPGYYPGEDGQPNADTTAAATSLQAGVPVAAAAVVSGRRLLQAQPTPATPADASGMTPATPAGTTTAAPASATAAATPVSPADSNASVPITGIGSLQLSQYSGIWGGKWCQSKFDPPSLDFNTSAKPECPRVNGTPLPDLRPVYLPPIVSLANGSILTVGPNGTQRAIALKAFNWGGFDDGSTFLSGLNANRSIGVGDMAIEVYRAQLLGFNAVRLPFRFSDLNLAPKNWSFRCNLETYDQIKAEVSQMNMSAEHLPLPSVLPSYSAAQSGFCNVYIPNVSTLSRFLWVVEYFVSAGFYVIPAYHPADYSVDNTVVSTPGIFLRNWANLWAAITELPLFNTTLQGRVLLDLISEPDIFGLEWASTTSRREFEYPPLPDLYGPTMQVILSINPGVFFLVEGTGQAGKVPGMAWGSGFVTDPAVLKQYNLSDPTSFFENLVQLPELYTRIIFSPHVYGPPVTGWSHGTQGGDLWNMLQVGFNWLATTGYTAKNGTGPLRFPIMVGEVGSKFDSDLERAFFKDFFVFANNITDAGRQTLGNLPSWAWYTDGTGASTLPQNINGSVNWPAMNALTTGLNEGSNDLQKGGLRLVPWYMASNGTSGSGLPIRRSQEELRHGLWEKARERTYSNSFVIFHWAMATSTLTWLALLVSILSSTVCTSVSQPFNFAPVPAPAMAPATDYGLVYDSTPPIEGDISASIPGATPAVAAAGNVTSGNPQPILVNTINPVNASGAVAPVSDAAVAPVTAPTEPQPALPVNPLPATPNGTIGTGRRLSAATCGTDKTAALETSAALLATRGVARPVDKTSVAHSLVPT
ncbi:g5888 [Coccomyxa elongata]